MNLDEMSPLLATVGYGRLGVLGGLGYEGKGVVVQGRAQEHALSTHPPARLVYELAPGFARFRCRVALNDDVPPRASHADFAVLADGRRVAVAPFVRAGEPPREIDARISGARRLELVVTTSRWERCHAVWLDPRLEGSAAGRLGERLVDCLGRMEVDPSPSLPPVERAIATVVSPGFDGFLDDMLGSLLANGRCRDARIVVFAIDPDAACVRVAEKYRAVLVRCRPKAGVNPMSKAVLDSSARVIDAARYLLLDADMLVLGDLRSVFAAIGACPEGSVLACREGNGDGNATVDHALRAVYFGDDADRDRLGITPEEAAYPLVVNDGVFAAGRAGMLALDAILRAMPEAAGWVDERRDNWWRNQFIFNLALARLSCGVELDGAYNVQLQVQDVTLESDGSRLRADWRGRPARVLHFNGGGKAKGREWRGHYARVPDPIADAGDGDAYDEFLAALRAWIGRHGASALAWSFYGTTDARSGRVRDPDAFPLLALLHYLIRSQGCVRVLESGTARGVSAACLASAVARRDGGRVVTFDPFPDPDRNDLWAALPEPWRDRIESRVVGLIEGMTAALAAGESYQAALLDSVHTEEHVWAEFELASRLVCPGGLILIHDCHYAHGTVEGALGRIERAGFGVVRLGTADEGVREDDRLGLAVVENRRHP
jgi:predicted O-methyltransferase YrrM